MSELEIGQVVPDFTLPASTGSNITLSDYRGKKVIIYFYPKDSTPACTQEACDFRDQTKLFADHNAVVLGISPDLMKSHDRFAAKHELSFPLLSDPEHQVAELFGVWKLKKLYGREYMGIERSTFLIDEEGKLTQAWRKVRVKGHVDQVLQASSTS
ncbi:thioredoxin-dependent thiol peroxidase [Paenibacillus sp. N1-5-1-14]|uniref:thioredoxin-dependent thiol peroxidase n=1 Tax=Paenibacillus radicibacter TaxID=2972488 RepID=UPI002158EFC5|nr:thioredoxin-dependent thiol peroxidase [Paenibacillus radicibacter]MCR8643036.1 thioredoxin-dependent thiol peroxidase [Paenibacillus radicibacter]